MGTKTIDKVELPQEWIRAYERDADAQPDYADPSWERKAARALAADHADLDHLVAELNAFFNERQPRRVGRS